MAIVQRQVAPMGLAGVQSLFVLFVFYRRWTPVQIHCLQASLLVVVHLGAVREAFASFESPEVFANSEGFEFIWEFGSSALVSAVPDAEFGGHDVDVLGVVVAAGAAPEEIVVQAGQFFPAGLCSFVFVLVSVRCCPAV
jgi:hypothetical protein